MHKVFTWAVILLFVAHNLTAQEETTQECGSLDEHIIQAFALTANELATTLTSKCDPYGMELAVQVAANGSPYTQLPSFQLLMIAEAFAASQQFDQFPVNGEKHGKQFNNLWHFRAGSTPDFLTDKSLSTIALTGYQYSCKQSLNGTVTQFNIQTRGFVYTQTPNDGIIHAKVYYFDKNGAQKPWEQGDWSNAKLFYKRTGPGDDFTNSKLERDADLQQSDVTIESFTPGHYQPKVVARGCTQDFTDTERFRFLEAIIELEDDWDGESWMVVNSKLVPKTSVKASEMDAPEIVSQFSLGNVVKGTIYDQDGNPLDESVTVVLERQFEASIPLEITVESKPDGTYSFENVESGMYHVYVQGSKHEGFAEAIVCNNPLKGETANFTYKDVDINAPLNLVFLIETTETYQEAIEPLLLEGGYRCPAGTIERKTKGYTLVKINSLEIDDFFGEGFANSVTGTFVPEKNQLLSYGGKTYSFDPGAETAELMIVEKIHQTDEFDKVYPEQFIWPDAVPSNRLFISSDAFRIDSIFSYAALNSKYAKQKFEVFFGAGVIEGQGIDIEAVSHQEAEPITFGELYHLAKNGSGSISREQQVKYKQGYNTNFLGLGQFLKPEEAEHLGNLITYLDISQQYLDQNQKHFTDATGMQLFPENFSSDIDNTPMDTFMKTAFNDGKNSGMFESLAAMVTIKREIVIKPFDAKMAEKYFQRGSFEVGPKQSAEIDLDESIEGLKELLKGIKFSN